MSEVKPTLAYYNIQNPSPNSWLVNFPSGKWIDAQSRDWFWIMINAVSFVSAYEYKVRFDVPAKSMTLIFPFVVKTSDKNVEKVFIDGVEHRARSKGNYGNMFVVSGSEFSFKVATKNKLAKQTVPIIAFEYKQAVFRSIEFLTSDYIRLRFTSSEFNTVKTIETNYIATRNTQTLYITSNTAICNYIRIRTTSSTFNNVNVFSVVSITAFEYKQAVFRSIEFLTSDYIRLRFTSSEFNTVKTIETNYIATRNTQTLYITSNTAICNYIRIRTTSSTFNNVNVFSVPVIANCRDLYWARFGGIWQSCETWMPLT